MTKFDIDVRNGAPSRARYQTAELFHTWQGEGVHMGLSAVFVRLMGCDQNCPFCDSAGTWHKDYLVPREQRLSLDEWELAARVQALLENTSPDTFVVLTGGEPTLWNLRPFLDAMHRYFLHTKRIVPVHIETAGHRELPNGAHWVTLSPKYFATPPLPYNMRIADEIKLICTSVEQTLEDLLRIEASPFRDSEALNGVRKYVWLHPEWSQRNNTELLDAITQIAKVRAGVRAGYQLHKIYANDKLDPNSDKRNIPLGGIFSNGPSS